MVRTVLYDGEDAYTLMMNAIRGKPFQHLLAPERVVRVSNIQNRPKTLGDNYPIAVERLPGSTQSRISVKELSNYVEISEDQFKEYEEDQSLLQDIVLLHKDSSYGRKILEEQAKESQ